MTTWACADDPTHGPFYHDELVTVQIPGLCVEGHPPTPGSERFACPVCVGKDQPGWLTVAKTVEQEKNERRA